MHLPVRAPFHLEATVRLLQRRPGNRVDVWDGRRYLRGLCVGGVPTLCSLSNAGSLDRPRLELSLSPAASPAATAAAARTLSRMLGLQLAPGFAVAALHEPRLDALAHALRGARPPRFPTLFEAFGRIIPYQQLSLDAGSAIAGRFAERFGERIETPAGEVWLFPEPQRVARASARQFAGIGLNRRKADALRGLAQRLVSGALSAQALARLPTADALRSLQALPGIGPWTASLVLLRGLGRMDVFPVGDVGVQRGLRGLLGPEADVAAIADRAADRKGYLYFYALGARLLREGLIRSAGT